jgi:peroxiredoxin
MIFKRLFANLLTLTLLMVLVSANAKVGYHVGDTAPGFNLKTLKGNKVSLDELRQKSHVLLVFWAVECVYCYAHIKDFNALHDKYHDKGLTVAAINVAGEYDVEVAEYVKDNKLKYLVLSDRLNNLDAAEAYHVVGTPTLVLVSPEGKVVYYGYQIPDVTKWVK